MDKKCAGMDCGGLRRLPPPFPPEVRLFIVFIGFFSDYLSGILQDPFFCLKILYFHTSGPKKKLHYAKWLYLFAH
jgi:hypothetical protein